MLRNMFQTMKNIPIPKIVYERGKTYILVGFVDLHSLLMGTIQGEKGKVRIVGYEMSEICVAKSLVLYEMMKIQMGPISILQVWFSTGWSNKTSTDFKLACTRILDQKLAVNCDVKDLINHWVKTTLSLTDAKEKWRAVSLSGSLFPPVGNLCKKEDRIDYCRYYFTGQIFKKHIDVQKHGNITMFSMNGKFSEYAMMNDSIFSTLSLSDFNYTGNFIDCFENQMKEGLKNLLQNIKDGNILCEFKVMAVTPTDQKCLKEIHALDPYQIDWSNIQDYLGKNEFLHMARSCSTAQTCHVAHFMNWSKFIFGTFILDYEGMAGKVHEDMKRVFEAEYNMLHDQTKLPFFFKDKYFVHPWNLSSNILAHSYRNKFLDYFFKGEKVIIGDVQREFQSNFFQRPDQIFHISFSFPC